MTHVKYGEKSKEGGMNENSRRGEILPLATPVESAGWAGRGWWAAGRGPAAEPLLPSSETASFGKPTEREGKREQKTSPSSQAGQSCLLLGLQQCNLSAHLRSTWETQGSPAQQDLCLMAMSFGIPRVQPC